MFGDSLFAHNLFATTSIDSLDIPWIDICPEDNDFVPINPNIDGFIKIPEQSTNWSEIGKDVRKSNKCF